jgi:hypothetical protein
LLTGHDLDHPVASRLPPARVAVGFRLLARNLAIGLQLHDAQGRPATLREPAAFRAAHVDGLGTFVRDARASTIHLAPLRAPHSQPRPPHRLPLPWTGLTVLHVDV